MKILQIGKFYPIHGGVEKVMRDLTIGLSRNGVECDMLCCKTASDPIEAADEPFACADGRNTVITLNSHGRIICVPAWKKVAATMISPAMIWYMRCHADTYDLVHIHHPDPMAALALFLSGYKGKVILHWHSDILTRKALLRLFRPLQQWLIHRAALIIGTTPVYVAQSPYLKHVQHKVTYVPIGIDPMPQVVTPGHEPYVNVCSIGRLVPYKGYRYLIEAMSMLPERYRLVIVGKGPLQQTLQAQIDAMGLHQRVTLAGFIPDQDLPGYLARCDVYVVSSIWKTEAFCIAQIEAMSMGRPVVATAIPESGVPWVNAHGESGLNVPVQDARALADAIRAITATPEQQAGYASRARHRFETLFTLEAMTRAVQACYQQICTS